MGDHPQSILNRQLVDRCDLLVAVFRTRLGTPTPHGPSGTAEEIERFIASRKPVLLYKLNGREDGDTDLHQLAALNEFMASLRQRG
jgi:nucleoside 2-deoxyribosyltransferase